MKTTKKPRTPRTTLNKRTPAQCAQDLADIARLLHEGKAHREIADWIWLKRPYKLSRTQITYDSAEWMRNWRANAAEVEEDRIARQLPFIDVQEAEAWKAWHKSIGEVTEIQEEQIDGPNSEGGKPRSRAVVKKSMSHGDLRYMHIISDCIEARNAPLQP